MDPTNGQPTQTREYDEAAQPDMDEILKAFWKQTLTEASSTTGKYSLPLSRIKKIMRFDEDVNMVSQEVLKMFDKCCVFFIQELTLRTWQCTLAANRKTIKRKDIAQAIAKTDDYDFLIDVVPREEWQIRATATSTKPAPQNSISSNAQLQQFLLGRAATPQLVAQYQASLLQSQLPMQSIQTQPLPIPLALQTQMQAQLSPRTQSRPQSPTQALNPQNQPHNGQTTSHQNQIQQLLLLQQLRSQQTLQHPLVMQPNLNPIQLQQLQQLQLQQHQLRQQLQQQNQLQQQQQQATQTQDLQLLLLQQPTMVLNNSQRTLVQEQTQGILDQHT